MNENKRGRSIIIKYIDMSVNKTCQNIFHIKTYRIIMYLAFVYFNTCRILACQKLFVGIRGGIMALKQKRKDRICTIRLRHSLVELN